MKGHFEKRRRKDPKTGKLRTSSLWTVWYDEPVAPGEPRKLQTKSGFATRKKAEEWFATKADELRKGIRTYDEKTMLAEYLRDWVEKIDVQGYTRRAYSIFIECYLIPTLGNVRLCDLRPAHVEAARDRWLKESRFRGTKPLSPRSVKHIYDTLRVALNKARKQQVIAINPCDMVEAPKFEQKEMRAMEADTANALLDAFNDLDIGPAIVTSLGTGLRRGELLALQWRDIDLDGGRLTVHRALECIQGNIRFKEPKTKRSRRTIALPSFVVDRLRRHRLDQAQRLMQAGYGRPTPETMVFDREGKPWNPDLFGLEFAGFIESKKLPKVCLHDLRHGFATLALTAGVDLKTVSAALGHSTLATTADIYAHVTESLMQSAADRLDASLTTARKKASGQ